MDSLLERQARFTFHDEMQQTPLHLAAQHGMFAHVEALARRVASGLNERDDKGRTPLHNAAINGHRLAILIKSVSICFCNRLHNFVHNILALLLAAKRGL